MSKYIIYVFAATAMFGCRPTTYEYASVGEINFPGGDWDPAAAAVAPDGAVYVADISFTSAVQAFDRDGVYLGGFGGFGRSRGDTPVPTDVAVDTDGFIYVTEFGARRVGVFDSRGALVRTAGEGVLVTPLGVAADVAGRIWVADAGAGGVVAFGRGGAPTAVWGKDKGVARAVDVTLTPSGEVAVVIADDPAVRFFAPDGTPGRVYTAARSEEFEALELAVDVDGVVYVLGRREDPGGAYTAAVRIFEKGGRFREELDLDLTDPTGLAARDDGVLIITDPGRHVVRLYRRQPVKHRP